MLAHIFTSLLSGASAPAAASVSVGAPGKARQYVIYIDGKPYVDTFEGVQSVLQSLAEREAQKAIEKAKAPRKPSIVVKPGKELPKPAEIPQTVQIQAQVQEFYQSAFDAALSALMARKLAELAAEMDDEEAMLLL